MSKEIPEFNRGLWFWRKEFKDKLKDYSEICGHDFTDIEYERIIKQIRYTNDELNNWFYYSMEGRLFKLEFKFAYDGEEREDMIHIRIKGPEELKEKVDQINSN